MAKPLNPYEILGVDRNSSLPEIKEAYQKLAKKYHPLDLILEEMNDIKVAFSILEQSRRCNTNKVEYDIFTKAPVSPPFISNKLDSVIYKGKNGLQLEILKGPTDRREDFMNVVKSLDLYFIFYAFNEDINLSRELKENVCEDYNFFNIFENGNKKFGNVNIIPLKNKSLKIDPRRDEDYPVSIKIGNFERYLLFFNFLDNEGEHRDNYAKLLNPSGYKIHYENAKRTNIF